VLSLARLRFAQLGLRPVDRLAVRPAPSDDGDLAELPKMALVDGRAVPARDADGSTWREEVIEVDEAELGSVRSADVAAPSELAGRLLAARRSSREDAPDAWLVADRGGESLLAWMSEHLHRSLLVGADTVPLDAAAAVAPDLVVVLRHETELLR
jgi:hypothetical protein